MLVFKKRDELLGREAAYSTVTCCKAQNTQAEIFPGICSFFLWARLSATTPFLLCYSFITLIPRPFTARHFLKSQTRNFPQFLITSSSSNSARKFDVSSSFWPSLQFATRFLANAWYVGEEWTQEVCLYSQALLCFSVCRQRRTRISETRCRFATDTGQVQRLREDVTNAQMGSDQNEKGQ